MDQMVRASTTCVAAESIRQAADTTHRDKGASVNRQEIQKLQTFFRKRFNLPSIERQAAPAEGRIRPRSISATNSSASSSATTRTATSPTTSPWRSSTSTSSRPVSATWKKLAARLLQPVVHRLPVGEIGPVEAVEHGQAVADIDVADAGRRYFRRRLGEAACGKWRASVHGCSRPPRRDRPKSSVIRRPVRPDGPATASSMKNRS